jgi:hypothetical protein
MWHPAPVDGHRTWSSEIRESSEREKKNRYFRQTTLSPCGHDVPSWKWTKLHRTSTEIVLNPSSIICHTIPIAQQSMSTCPTYHQMQYPILNLVVVLSPSRKHWCRGGQDIFTTWNH